MTSSNGHMFRVTGHLYGEFTSHRWIPHTKAGEAELWCFLWSASNKRLCKQSRGWWFEMPSRPFWRHCNERQPWYWPSDPCRLNLVWMMTREEYDNWPNAHRYNRRHNGKPLGFITMHIRPLVSANQYTYLLPIHLYHNISAWYIQTLNVAWIFKHGRYCVRSKRISRNFEAAKLEAHLLYQIEIWWLHRRNNRAARQKWCCYRFQGKCIHV